LGTIVTECVGGQGKRSILSITVEQCSDYSVLRQAILKAYELVPEAYRQKFQNSTKQDSQTYIEFARQNEALFDRWCAAKTVEKDFNKLRQLMLVEESKKCLHSDVKMYLDEQKANSLHQAAILADEYCLTHKSSFETKGASHLEGKQSDKSFPDRSLPPSSGGYGRGEGSRDQRRRGPTCFYCKRKGHMISECWSLERKEKNRAKADLIVRKAKSAPTVDKTS